MEKGLQLRTCCGLNQGVQFLTELDVRSQQARARLQLSSVTKSSFRSTVLDAGLLCHSLHPGQERVLAMLVPFIKKAKFFQK